ncbi:hypothetical protein EQG67_15725 [Kosakonia cowanii]|nr:hypothetical protein EH164_16015 [Kosakonia sp. CCTCC M2018092]QAR47106.1 hypothetical protein EQG67_15725 [Kosakonia cowanii]
MRSGEGSCGQRRGERQALHETSGKSGLHGRTTTSVMELKKVPYYSKSYTGRHLTLRVRV